VQVQFEPNKPPSQIGLSSLIPMIRFTAAQKRKTAVAENPDVVAPERKASRSAGRQPSEE
jgi:hypothetical protein